MADGNYPGPKGLRERLLEIWRGNAAPAIETESVPERRHEAPAPELRPPGMSGPRPRALWPQPANDVDRRGEEEKRNYLEDLKARVRGERREGRSLLRRDFDRERE